MAASEPSEDRSSSGDDEVHTSRLELLWDVLVFQLKLLADGLRDLLLSPLSLGAALLGLLFGGDRPGRYLQAVLRFGRRTELWINLFGHRRRAGTADAMVDPVRDRVFTQAREHPWVNRTGTRINRTLDDVNAAFAARERSKSDD